MSATSMALRIYGIKTHNLKGFNVEVERGGLIGVFGVSGGGKSSLCYDTIYSICRQEFNAIEKGFVGAGDYDVAGFDGVLPAVAINQVNYNSNPRSSLYTHFNIASYLRPFATQKGKLSGDIYKLLKIGGADNACKACEGLGVLYKPRISMVVDNKKMLCEMPFFPWGGDHEAKKTKLLEAFCLDVGIKLSARFLDLSHDQRELLLYGESEKSYQISFKYKGKYRSRRLRYIGVMQELEEFLGSDKKSFHRYAANYAASFTCDSCGGARVDIDKYSDLFVFGLPFSDFLRKEVSELKDVVQNKEVNPCLASRHLYDLFSAMCEVGISYLALSRSVPSLSGGELQKLNFAKLTSSRITNVLIVLDEVSSQTHVSDMRAMVKRIKEMAARSNSIILVEHNELFLSHCNFLWEVGPEPGSRGGELKVVSQKYSCDWKSLLKKQYVRIKSYASSPSVPRDWYRLASAESSNGIVHDIDIPSKSITSIVGKSGSGKTTLAKSIERGANNVVMVRQEFPRGNIRSTVATFLGLGDVIANFYSKKTMEPPEVFNPGAGKLGACNACDGSGKIKYDRSFEESEYVSCHSCNGEMFSDLSSGLRVSGLSVADLYATHIQDLDCSVFEISRLKSARKILSELGLGHVSVGRKISSLSGGESRRIKLAKLLMKRAAGKVLVVDEPGAGLDERTACSVMSCLRSYADRFEAVIVIDHKPSIFLLSDYLIEVGPGAGSDGGQLVFLGSPEEYFEKVYVMQC